MIRKITLTDSEILMDYDDTDLYGPGVEIAIDELIIEYSSMIKKQIPRADQQKVWLAVRSLWIEKILGLDMRLDSGTSVYGTTDEQMAEGGETADDIETDKYFGIIFNLKRIGYIHPDLYLALKSKLNSNDPALVSQAKDDIDRIKNIKMEGKRLYEE